MSKKPLAPNACAPRFHIGTIVNYTDHRGKDVQGQIIAATANWNGYGKGAEYTLTYQLSHPTSSRHQHHGEGKIHGEVE